MKLEDYPRPERDNGRGLHWSASIYHPTNVDEWMARLRAMNIRWLKVLDDGGGSSLRLCGRLLDEGIMPIVRLYREQQNPGHIGHAEEKTIRALVKMGARYIETNNEPDLQVEWKFPRPIDWLRIVAEDWIYDAGKCLDAGALPGVPALSVGRQDDLLQMIVERGGRDALAAGAWIAIHNYTINHPLDYPDDDVNQRGTPLTPADYAADGAWAWDNLPLDTINAWRWQDKNPGDTINEDASCFRSFEFVNGQALRALGFSLPILTTEGGVVVGWREDRRYPRVTPRVHQERTVAIFSYMQTSAPPYYFACCPWLIANFALGHHAPGWESQAWFTNWWDGQFSLNGRLPTVDAVMAMPTLSRLETQGPQHSTIQGDVAAMRNVGGLRVMLRSEGFSQASTTGDGGHFRFGGLAPGVYTLQAGGLIKAGLQLDGTNTLSFPSLRPPVPVSPDLDWDKRLSDVRVTVSPAQAGAGERIWKLVRAHLRDRDQAGAGGMIYCDVLDELGRPLAGQEVILSWSTGLGRKATELRESPAHGVDFPIAEAYNPAHGPGPYAIAVDGLPSDQVVGLGLPLGQSVSFVLVFQRAPAAGARGSRIEGTLIGAAEGAAVILRHPDGKSQQARTGSDGRFAFSNLPPGAFALDIAGHGAAGRDVLLDGTNLVVFDYTMPGRGSSLRGRVIGGQAGLDVYLYADNGDERRAALDEQGIYEFRLLAAGVYRITVAGQTVGGLSLDGVSTVDVPAIDLRVLVGSIVGSVRSTDGRALAGVTVYLAAANDNQSETKTDSSGVYRFADLPMGAYTVRCGQASQSVILRGPDAVRVDLVAPADPGEKLLSLAMLFGPLQALGTRANLRLAQRYVRAFAPTVVFRVEEAQRARQVLIVGDVQAVSETDEEQLRAAGCTVARIGGTPYTVEDALQRLVAAHSPMPKGRAAVVLPHRKPS
jgi:hypothetical protein